jgi:hypothetical protein
MGTALCRGLRNSLKQWDEQEVTLAELLKSRDCPRALRLLVRKLRGHEYARLFETCASVSGPSEADCLATWIDAILDKVSDQVCHKVVGTRNWSTIDKVRAFMREVRDQLTPTVERIVAKLGENPSWLPRKPSAKGQASVDGTVELMNVSLLGRSANE